MMLKIKCPECNTEGGFSLVEPGYEGPYRCWKCQALLTIKIENNELKLCQPLSQEDFEKQQALEALKAKFKKR